MAYFLWSDQARSVYNCSLALIPLGPARPGPGGCAIQVESGGLRAVRKMESVVKTTTETSEALSQYAQRVWKVSNYWREPPCEVGRPPSVSVKKVLIVLSDTGGGHKASASAISAALEELRPEGIEIKVVDVLENYTLWFSNRLYNVRMEFP